MNLAAGGSQPTWTEQQDREQRGVCECVCVSVARVATCESYVEKYLGFLSCQLGRMLSVSWIYHWVQTR